MSIRANPCQSVPIRVNPCQSVSIRANPWRRKHPGHTTCLLVFSSSRLLVFSSSRLRGFAASRETISQTPHPRTPVRGSPDRTPNTEHRKPNLCVSLRDFAASREPDSLQSPRAAQPPQNRSRAGTPELYSFVSIRFHSWFKSPPLAIIRENPCQSVAKKHSWHTTCPRSVA